MPNVILIQADIRGQKTIIGGYSSHGWARDSQVTQIINGMDLTMRIGGDETSFLFNITHNLRFDTTHVKDNNGEIPIYTTASQIFNSGNNDEDMGDESDE